MDRFGTYGYDPAGDEGTRRDHRTPHGRRAPLDLIPHEDWVETTGPTAAGMTVQRFFACNTVVTLQAFAPHARCCAAFDAARAACRRYERLFSRTLPHSDIARLNAAGRQPVAIAPETADLLDAALRYCADSAGRFDITMGAVTRLWGFHRGIVPDRENVEAALAHVGRAGLHVWRERESGQAFAQLDDPRAAVDVGGVAKGWIADALDDVLAHSGVTAFVVNLGGNVLVRGRKPGDAPWRIGLQDPREKGGVVGTIDLTDASAVTSGVYERCFTRNDVRFHHILDPATGYPARTDAAGVTVIARRSLDAEGYSTTLLALGIEQGRAFARAHEQIEAAYFVDEQGQVVEA